ncbi:MAG TPA: tRNA pseudouridine(13) synthase TruD [Planctomycetota bacterium]|nr:tRNA pseudouridine(13) synthase TruD [Planctomycetota bacterium]
MRLKARPEDFRVVELLDPTFLGEGPYAVYRVVKEKWTTLEVLGRLAREAGVEKSAVAYAGMKDRQGIAVQHFSVEGGRRIALREEGLLVRFLGPAPRPIGPPASRGNAFEIVARALGQEDLARLRANLLQVRSGGLPNYFDDQRFGCLRHGQGFVAKDLLEGNVERALRQLVAAPSPFDDPETGGFKAALRRAWGDWERCTKIARPREHFSLFRHLASAPGDFRGAFAFVAQRLRVLHLHAFQSHLWNHALGHHLRGLVPPGDRVFLRSDDGPLLCPRRLPVPPLARLDRLSFPLPAPDSVVPDASVRRALDEALAAEGLTLDRLQVEGIPGFAFKAEGRAAWLRPGHLRVRPAQGDELARGKWRVTLRFDLPRGAYATLVLKRLFAPLGPEPRDARIGPALRVSGELPASLHPHPPSGPRSLESRAPRGAPS